MVKPDIETDLRYPLKCGDNMVDGIYSGHTIEHLYPAEANRLICEMFRILKPGGWLRINCPDIEKYVDFYLGKECDPKFSNFNSGCAAICTVTQDHGHHSAWDEKQMTDTLRKTGFTSIRKVQFGVEGFDQRLIKEEAVRRWETLVVEAQKPS
jgi:predicted SAM-dependent methyltransferase